MPTGQSIKSAWVAPNSSFGFLYFNNANPKNRPNVWLDWWLNEITVAPLTKTLTDTLSSGGGSFTFS